MKCFEQLKSDIYDISINWDLTTICNKTCFYCYSRKNKKLWGKIANKKVITPVLNFLLLTSKRVDINILGGESAFSPFFITTLRACQKNKNVKYLKIFTGGAAVNRLKHAKFICDKKTTIVLTFHPSETRVSDFKQIIAEALKLTKNVNVHVMIPAKKYIHLCNEIINYCNMMNIIYRSHFVTIKNITRELDVQNSNEDLFNLCGTTYTLTSLIKQKLNSFYKWNCDAKTFDIDVNGNVSNMCLGYIGTVHDLSLLTADTVRECPNEFCTNACWLETKKWK